MKRAKESLELIIFNGTNLTAKDLNGKSDPYCKIKILNDPKSEKTKIVFKDLNPVWNHKIVRYDIKKDDLMNSEEAIIIDIYDHDNIGKNEFMGRAVITGDQVMSSFPVQEKYKIELTPRKNKKDKGVRGELHVGVLYNDPNFVEEYSVEEYLNTYKIEKNIFCEVYNVYLDVMEFDHHLKNFDLLMQKLLEKGLDTLVEGPLAMWDLALSGYMQDKPIDREWQHWWFQFLEKYLFTKRLFYFKSTLEVLFSHKDKSIIAENLGDMLFDEGGLHQFVLETISLYSFYSMLRDPQLLKSAYIQNCKKLDEGDISALDSQLKWMISQKKH